jgi:hypothetical protein
VNSCPHIKQRLFTPGPTPLLIEAQARTLAAANVLWTEAFRKIMSETIGFLKCIQHQERRSDVCLLWNRRDGGSIQRGLTRRADSGGHGPAFGDAG